MINTAASAYSWDNVYNYDITFQHLMAFNPNRSWVVTYNQMWNLSMRDPLPKNSQGGRNGSFQFHNHNQNNYNNQNGGKPDKSGGKKKPDYCWNFNKGIPCKFGRRCRFIERCSFCDSSAHGIFQCPKVEAKERKIILAGQHNSSKEGNNNHAHSSSS